MINRPFQLAIVLTGLAAAGPQAAWADSKPSLIQVIGELAPWKVTKACPASDGKCKIYESEPSYTIWNNVQKDCENAELKEAGATYTFKARKKYWIVFYPKNTKVAVKLAFQKGGLDNLITLEVKGRYAATVWTSGPTFTIKYKHKSDEKLIKFNEANFGRAIEPTDQDQKLFLELL